MKETQGQIINTLGRLYGASPGELINFQVTSQRNQEWSHYQMFTQPGQTWKGMDINIGISGSLNHDTGKGTFGSNLILGTDAWNQDGDFEWNQGGTDQLLMNSLANNMKKGGKPDEHSGTEWVGNWSFTWVIHTMDGVPTGEESLRVDYRFRLYNSYDWWQKTDLNTVTGETFGTTASGKWNAVTGMGTFSTEIVPEPVSIFAMSIGLAGIVGRRRQQKRAQ